jgi:hypothetical protein
VVVQVSVGLVQWSYIVVVREALDGAAGPGIVMMMGQSVQDLLLL